MDAVGRDTKCDYYLVMILMFQLNNDSSDNFKARSVVRTARHISQHQHPRTFLPHAYTIYFLSPACNRVLTWRVLSLYMACSLGANQSPPSGPCPSCIEPPFPIRFHQKGRRCSRHQLLQHVPQQVLTACNSTTPLMCLMLSAVSRLRLLRAPSTRLPLPDL